MFKIHFLAALNLEEKRGGGFDDGWD